MKALHCYMWWPPGKWILLVRGTSITTRAWRCEAPLVGLQNEPQGSVPAAPYVPYSVELVQILHGNFVVHQSVHQLMDAPMFSAPTPACKQWLIWAELISSCTHGTARRCRRCSLFSIASTHAPGLSVLTRSVEARVVQWLHTCGAQRDTKPSSSKRVADLGCSL
jgi:hypothetical protein